MCFDHESVTTIFLHLPGIPHLTSLPTLCPPFYNVIKKYLSPVNVAHMCIEVAPSSGVWAR